MKRLAWLLLLIPTLALSQTAQGPFGIFGGPIPSSLLAPPNQVPINTYAFTTDQGLLVNNGSAWVAVTAAGSASFGSITTGNNTSAVMTVDSGASLGFTGTGTIAATTAAALASTPAQCSGGQFSTGITAAGVANCSTPSGAGTVNSGTSGYLAYYASTGTAVSALQPTGTGSPVLGTGPTFTLPGFATASLPACNSSSKGQPAYTTDGTPAFVFCNGTNWVSNGGTKFTFTATGCTPSASGGNATAGSITLASGPCTAITITFNGAVGMTAADGWHCSVDDPTALNAGTWIPQWGAKSYTTTTATIPVPSSAGATDVLTFACAQF